MTPYGKVSQAAISASSLLAEEYDAKNPRRLNSGEIAKARRLSQAIVAKVLSTLSQAGIVTGAPGPGGGYTLARHPNQITLLEIVGPFERSEPNSVCPFGDNWCGNGPQCPLHDQLLKLRADVTRFLQTTTLERFRTAARKNKAQQAKPTL